MHRAQVLNQVNHRAHSAAKPQPNSNDETKKEINHREPRGHRGERRSICSSNLISTRVVEGPHCRRQTLIPASVSSVSSVVQKNDVPERVKPQRAQCVSTRHLENLAKKTSSCTLVIQGGRAANGHRPKVGHGATAPTSITGSRWSLVPLHLCSWQ